MFEWEKQLLQRPIVQSLLHDPLAAAKQGLSAWLMEAGGGSEHRAFAREQVATAHRLASLTRDVVQGVRVPVVLLKGAGLAQRVYRWPWARPASDVDIWVLPTDFAAAKKWLEANGFQQQADAGHHDVFREHHHVGFARGRDLVEVHFRLFRGFGGACFDDEAVFARRFRGDIEGVAVDYLSAEDELIYLAAHAANHAFMRLSWLLDLVYLVFGTVDFRWHVALQRAQQARLATPVSVALAVVQHALGVELPGLPQGQGLRSRVGGRYLTPGGLLGQSRWGPSLVGIALSDTPMHALRHAVSGARRLRRRMARR